MRPTTITALEAWESAHHDQQQAAATALRTAFPPLADVDTPTCCHLQLAWDQDNAGTGTVCVDQDSRAAIQFRGLPQRILGAAADAIFGAGWFDDAPDGLTDAEPGTYCWDDESTSAELEITVGDDGTASLHFGYAPVPDAVGLLDALQSAFTDA